MQASARSTLTTLVEDHLASLVRDASTVRRHAKRSRFAPRTGGDADEAGANPAGRRRGVGGGEGGADNEAAAAVRAARPLLHSDDVNLALAWRGSEKIYSTRAGGIAAPPVAVSPPASDGGGGGGGGGPGQRQKSSANAAAEAAPGLGPSSTGALADSTSADIVLHPGVSSGGGGYDDASSPVDLNAYLKSENAVRPPSELGLVGHWLAVDGIQPDIPQNPPPVGLPPHQAAGDHHGAGAGGGGGDEPHRIEDDEDDYEEDLLLRKRGRDGEAKGAGNDHTGPGSAGAAASSGGGPGGVSVRHLLPRLLSEELRLYFTRITLAVERGNPPQVDAALLSVGRDAGIQELVPFFVRFVAKSIYDNLGSADKCRTLVRLAGRMVGNTHVHLELHLHQMLPAIITCIVARRLSSPDAAGGGGDHWSLREEASRVLVLCCRKFGDRYPTLRARSLRTLCEALGPDRPLTTRYGGVVGLSAFGPRAVDAFLLPVATSYWEGWDEALRRAEKQEGGSGIGLDRNRAFEIRQCQAALLNALGVFLSDVTMQEQAERLDAEALADVFEEKLVPLQVGDTAEHYASCIL